MDQLGERGRKIQATEKEGASGGLPHQSRREGAVTGPFNEGKTKRI